MLSYLISLMEDLKSLSKTNSVLHLQLLKWVDLVQGPGLIVPNLMTATPVKVPA